MKSADITASGGRLDVTASDLAALSGVSIEIPEGALKATTKITIDQVAGSIIPDASLPKGPAADFGPEGLTFQKPVRITLPFQGTLDAKKARIFVLSHNNARQTLLPDAITIDAAKHTVSFSIGHFTRFQAGEATDACDHVMCADGSACSDGQCVTDGVVCDDPTDCTGDMPKAPTVQCQDGSTAGPTCVKENGACVWTVTQCQDQCQCGAEPDSQPCPDGSPPSVTCDLNPAGGCGWNVRCEPKCDCGGPPPTRVCDDGSQPPLSCDRNPAGACGWTVGACPNECDCGPIPPVAPCPDGNGPSISCDPDMNGSCQWNVGECLPAECDPTECGQLTDPSMVCGNGTTTSTGTARCERGRDGLCAWQYDCQQVCDCPPLADPSTPSCWDGSSSEAYCTIDPAGDCRWQYVCPWDSCTNSSDPTTGTSTSGMDAFPAPPPECIACAADSDCASGQTCLGGYCRWPSAQCRTDLECGMGYVCVANTCVPGNGGSCQADADCNVGEFCSNGQCAPSATCNSSMDCQPGFECISGSCQAVGVLCGNNVCGAGTYCCNPACGVCAPMGAACTQQACGGCSNMTCPAGQTCDATTNACVAIECATSACGPQPGLSNWTCANGETGGPTGRCVYVSERECGWEINWCTEVCADTECGDPPPASDPMCPNGGMGGWICGRDQAGTCGWTVSCP